MGFRLPLLRFTAQCIQELEHAYGLEMPREAGRGLVVHALEGQTNDVRVIARVVRHDGHILTRLWLPSPGFTSLDALKFEIVQAYFRAWVDRHRAPEATGEPDEIPRWLAFGALRARSADGAHDDIRSVLELWSEKQLPAFPGFVEDLKIVSYQDAVLAGFLAAWVKEKKAFPAILERLAAGEAWETPAFIAQLTGERESPAAERVFKERLVRLSRAVLSPGRASAWDLKNFRAQLVLDLGDLESASTNGVSTCTFREAIGRVADEPAVRQAAVRKMRELPLYAVRRGEGLAAVSEAYSRFLVMLSRGASAEKLGPLLDAAEAKLKEVVAHGGHLAPKAKAVENENGKNDNR